MITKINDAAITGTAQMISVKNSYRAGDTVQITVFRSGEYLTLSMTFDEQNNTQTTQNAAPQETANPGSGFPGGWPW